MNHTVQRLQSWYLNQCDGEWEHEFGIRIATLDNPGWSIDIDLEATPLAGLAFPRVWEDRSEADWVHCEVLDDVFRANCGASNLGEAIEVFLSWADAQLR